MHTHAKKPIGQRLLSAITLIAMVLGMASFASPKTVQADTVGGQVFLQGNYVEVGIHSNGYFGTSQNAPAGYHPIARTQLGFVADFGMDGWAIGTPPQSGDYFMPGTHEQGFAVKWGTYIANNNGSGSLAQIAPTSLTETSYKSEAVWVGQATSGADTLQMTRRVTANPNDLFFTIFVELLNTGSTTLSSVKYLENVDPDNDRDLSGGSYTTDNYIVYQPGVDGNPSIAQVAAVGTIYNNVAVRLSTNDSRARVSVGGFAVRDPDSVLNAPACTPNSTTVCNTAPGVVTRADIAISLAYNLGDLAPGESVTFQYRYLLSDIAANNPPVAVDDTYTTTQSTPLTVVAPGVLGNDTDTDGDPLTAVKDTDPTNGTLTLNADGSFIYTPTVGFNGSDSFTYHANDGQDDSNVATVTIDITATGPDEPTITSPTDGTVTNDNTPTFTGTAEGGATVVTVTLEAGGTVCVATVQLDNSWSCTPSPSTPLADDEYTFVAVADDGAGNVSEPSDPVTITIDTTAPAAPTVTAPISGTVTGDDTPTFEGTGEPDGTVTIYDDEGGIVCTTTVNPDGSWSCTPSSPLDEGEMTYEVTVTDPAGNESDPIDVTITIDTTAPVAPAITAPVSGTVITDPTLTFSGTAEIGTAVVTVTLEPSGAVVCVATVDPDGSWECTATAPLPNGEHTFTATGADEAGNESAPSDPVTVTIDASADIDVSVTELTSTQPPDTITTQTFEICNNGTLPLTYTISAGSLIGPLMLQGLQAINQVNAPGGTVLLLDSTASGSGVTSDEYNAATAMGFTVEVVDDATWASKTTEDFATYRALIIGDKDCTTGTSYLAAAEANKATWSAAVDGNVILIGADPGFHYSMLPAAQTLMQNGIGFSGDIEGKTGLYAAFGCAYYNAPVNTPVSFLSEIGSFLVGGNSWDDVHIVASHPALNGLTDENLSNWGQSTHMGFMSFPTGFVTLASQDNLTGPGNITFADGTNGIPYIVVRGEDVVVVGEPNITGIVPNTGPASGGTVVTITGTDLTDGTVTFGGVAATCMVDSDTQITCTTPPHAAGAVDVVVTTPSGSDTFVDGFTYTGNPWLGFDPMGGTVAPGTCDTITVTFDSTGLADGVYTGELTIDSNDPDSPTVIPVTLTVTSGAPLTVIAPISGTTTSDTPTFAGTGEPGNDITVYDDMGGVVCTSTVNPDGTWTCVVETPLEDGEQTFEVTQTDPWGTESDPVVVTITVDTTPVVITPPIITMPEDGDLTNDNTPTFTGIGDAGTMLTVTLEDGTFVCSTTVDVDGLWSCTPSTSLPDGEHTFVAVSGDGMGNESDPSEPVTITIDTVAPAPPTVTAPISGTVTSDTPTFAGTGEPGNDITVYDDLGGVVCTAVVDPDGFWTCVPTAPLPDGEQTFDVTQKEPAGNESDPVEVTITVDTTPVVITPPIITAPISGTVTNNTTPLFKGIGDAGTMLTVTLEDGTFVCATTVTPDGTWECTPGDPLSDGEYTVIAVSGDGAGNESDPSEPVMIKIDTVAPAPPVIITPAEGATTGALPTFTGTAEPGSTVRVEELVGTMVIVICEAVTDAGGNWTCTATVPLSAGEHTVTATAVDEAGNESLPDQVTFTVAPVQAEDDMYEVPEGIGSTLDVLANDTSASGGDITITTVGTPAHGVATTDGSTVIYTPTVGYIGPDSFTYTISDETSEDTALVTLTVLPVADLEVAQTVRGTIEGLEFTLVARNLGPRPANGAVISDTFPASLGSITWTCEAAGGAVCPNASGTGHIEETLATLPAGGVVTYTVEAYILVGIQELNTVTITPPVGTLDLDMSNNSATRPTLYRLIFPIISKSYMATP